MSTITSFPLTRPRTLRPKAPPTIRRPRSVPDAAMLWERIEMPKLRAEDRIVTEAVADGRAEWNPLVSDAGLTQAELEARCQNVRKGMTHDEAVKAVLAARPRAPLAAESWPAWTDSEVWEIMDDVGSESNVAFTCGRLVDLLGLDEDEAYRRITAGGRQGPARFMKWTLIGKD